MCGPRELRATDIHDGVEATDANRSPQRIDGPGIYRMIGFASGFIVLTNMVFTQQPTTKVCN
jgi:hypothetical protein